MTATPAPTTETTPEETVVIYTTSSCGNCTRTKRFFDSRGIDYVEVDASEGTAAHERLKAMGAQQVPVVFAGDLQWSGMRPDMIVRYAASRALADQQGQAEQRIRDTAAA
jgi:glutaredoxin-like protein NrdH